MRITSHRHHTFKNICINSYADGLKNLKRSTDLRKSSSVRIRHFLAGIVLLTPVVNCVAQTFFIKAQKKKHALKVQKQKKNFPNPVNSQKKPTKLEAKSTRQKKHDNSKEKPLNQGVHSEPEATSTPKIQPLNSQRRKAKPAAKPNIKHDNPKGKPSQRRALVQPEVEASTLKSPKKVSFNKEESKKPKIDISKTDETNSSFSTAKVKSIPTPSSPASKALTKPIFINSDDEIRKLLNYQKNRRQPEKCEAILRTLEHCTKLAWKKYIDQARYGPDFSWLPPLELLDKWAFEVGLTSQSLIYHWPSYFIRDCAFEYPRFAVDCINKDILWESLMGCTDEIIDICRVNSTAAWDLIQVRTDNYFTQETLLSILKGAYQAIINESSLTGEQVAKISLFLSACKSSIPIEHYKILKKIAASFDSNMGPLKLILKTWQSQGIIR